MYSLHKIKKFRRFNEWFVHIIYTLIFGLFVIQIPDISLLGKIYFLITTFVLTRILYFISVWVVMRVYKPHFFLRKRMRITEVITREVSSWGKSYQIYDDEKDYETRKRFEKEMRVMLLSYIFTLVFFTFLEFLIIIQKGVNIYFLLNWKIAFSAFLVILIYNLLFGLVEEWEFERVRFKKVNYVRIITDYIAPIVIFSVLALWIFFDPSSFEKIIYFLNKFY